MRLRAAEATAGLISARGVASATLEAVAAQADCSVHSLYAVFGGRDGLLQVVYDRYIPQLDIERCCRCVEALNLRIRSCGIVTST